MATSVKILEKRQNLLLDRTELVLSVYHPQGSTPTKKAVAKQISEQLNVAVDNIIVRDCSTRFGTHITSATAKVYTKKASLERIEHKFVLDRILKETEGKEVVKTPRKIRKEEKNKKKKIRGTMQAYLKKATKRQEKNGG
ncbi:small subunit ribosomal protein S24e [Nematocida homosporus]|uniref:small subunit ribosomal protein S24e n=1 Tax=Nematocida homosporus TaxID=1912981 RepID=UPI00222008A7|nr:small subunit ribosomal protein S24e [Nematocida homosporus]KAI5185977.1 small subunit ribosomal protein S24e [Nematocida homosporus]